MCGESLGVWINVEVCLFERSGQLTATACSLSIVGFPTGFAWEVLNKYGVYRVMCHNCMCALCAADCGYVGSIL